MEHMPKEKKRAKNRRACPLPGDESQLPVHYSAGEPRLEIIGDRVLVDGLRRVTPRSAWCCKWASAG